MHVHAAAQHVGDRLRRRRIVQQRDVDAGGAAQPFGGEMQDAAAVAGGEVELALALLGERDQLRQRVDAEIGLAATTIGCPPTKPIGTKSRTTSTGKFACSSGSAM